MSSLTPYGKNSTTTPKAAARPIPRAGQAETCTARYPHRPLWRAVVTMNGIRHAREQTSGRDTYLIRVLMMISKPIGSDIRPGKERVEYERKR